VIHLPLQEAVWTHLEVAMTPCGNTQRERLLLTLDLFSSFSLTLLSFFLLFSSGNLGRSFATLRVPRSTPRLARSPPGAPRLGRSAPLDSLGESLFNGFLPPTWAKSAPATEKKLGSWMLHFTGRHQQYDKWIAEGEPPVIWESGLHIPESYLTALVQTTCRSKNWALDKSTLYTVVTAETKPEAYPVPLEQGCYVRGLYLEGASWDVDACELRTQEPKVLVVELPILQVIPIEASKLKLTNTFRTPVYVTQSRRNAMGVGLVFEADLASTEHTSLWVLQGVALCLNIESYSGCWSGLCPEKYKSPTLLTASQLAAKPSTAACRSLVVSRKIPSRCRN